MPGPTRPPEPIWARPDRGTRGPQPEHTRADIAAAALALADSAGLPAATMRAVAAALGTSAGALYRYLSSRDDLLDLMVDAAVAELPLDRPTGAGWLEDLVALGRDLLALYLRHPWMLEAGLRGTPLGPHTIDYFECCLRIMEPVDRSLAAKMEAIGMMTGVVTLFARSAAPGRPLTPAQMFAAIDPDRHPLLVAAFSRATPAEPRPDLFDRTLRSVLRDLRTDTG